MTLFPLNRTLRLRTTRVSLVIATLGAMLAAGPGCGGSNSTTGESGGGSSQSAVGTSNDAIVNGAQGSDRAGDNVAVTDVLNQAARDLARDATHSGVTDNGGLHVEAEPVGREALSNQGVIH